MDTTLPRLDLAFEAGDLAWWELDCRTGAVRFHRRKAEMLGFDPGQFRHYTDFTTLLHPDDHDATVAAMRAHLSGERSEYRVDYRLRTRDGGYRWLQDVGRITERDESGRPVIVTGVVLDISERKRVEAALRDEQERLRALFHGHSAIKLVIDPDTGEIVDANAAAAAFYGWPLSALTGMRIQQINVLDPAGIERAMSHAAASRQARFEFVHRTADGSTRDVEVFCNRVDVGGRRLLYSIIHDIGDRKRAETALRIHERNLEHAEEFAHFGHWEFALADRVVRASRGAQRIYGIDRAEVPLEVAQQCVVAETRPRLDAALRALVEHDRPYDQEYWIRRASDGASVAVHSRAEFDRQNQVVFGVAQDITARKRIEEDRETLILQLQSAIEHIKTLKGIIPICASCKKVRDDRGYWEQVERYLARHTEAQFSHGICPDCLEKQYPDFR